MKSSVILLCVIGLCYGQIEPLRPLPDNKLLEGDARDISNARTIQRGREADVTGFADGFYKPSVVLQHDNLMNVPIITRPAAQKMLENREGKFMLSEVKATHNGRNFRMFALQVSPEGEAGYWVPINKHTEIPRIPTGDQPRYVFTPDFCGCTFTITPSENNMLRVRHVQGNLEGRQFNRLSTDEKGGPISYAMQFKDYGYHELHTGEIVQNTGAFTFMEFTNGEWRLHYQLQVNTPIVGNIRFHPKTNRLQSMAMSLPLQGETNNLATYVPFSKTFSVPRSEPSSLENTLRNFVKHTNPRYSNQQIDNEVASMIRDVNRNRMNPFDQIRGLNNQFPEIAGVHNNPEYSFNNHNFRIPEIPHIPTIPDIPSMPRIPTIPRLPELTMPRVAPGIARPIMPRIG